MEKVKDRGKRTEIPIEETFNFRETKREKKKKEEKNLSKDLDEHRTPTPSSSSSERVPGYNSRPSTALPLHNNEFCTET